MYIYIQSEPGLWTAGCYRPDGEWIAESDHMTEADAAERVHWLNGGASDSDLIDAAQSLLVAWNEITEDDPTTIVISPTNKRAILAIMHNLRAAIRKVN